MLCQMSFVHTLINKDSVVFYFPVGSFLLT